MGTVGFTNEDIFANVNGFQQDENDWRNNVETRNGYQVIPQSYYLKTIKALPDEARGRIFDDTRKENVLVEGFDEIPSSKKDVPMDEMGFFDRIGKSVSDRYNKISERATTRLEQGGSLAGTIVGTVLDSATNLVGGIGDVTGEVVMGGLGLLGNIPLVGSAGKWIANIPKSIIESNPETVGKAVGAISESLTELEAYKAKNPNAATAIETIQTIAEVFGARAVSQFGKVAIKAADKVSDMASVAKKVDVPLYLGKGEVNPEFKGIVRAFNVTGDNEAIISKRVNDIATAIDRGDINMEEVLNLGSTKKGMTEKVSELASSKRSLIPEKTIDITKNKSLNKSVERIVSEASDFLSRMGVDDDLYLKNSDLNKIVKQLKKGKVSINDLSEFSTKFKTEVNNEIFTKKGTEKAGTLADLNPSFKFVEKFVSSKVPKKNVSEFNDITTRMSGVINARNGMDAGTVSAINAMRSEQVGGGIISKMVNAYNTFKNPTNAITQMGGASGVDRSMKRRMEDASKLLKKKPGASNESKIKKAAKISKDVAQTTAGASILGITDTAPMAEQQYTDKK